MRLSPFALLAVAFLAPSARAELRLRLEVAGKGTIVIDLDEKAAPKTVAQIVRLAKSGFYDDMPFFRVERTPRPYLAWFGDPAARKTPDSPNLGKGGSGTRIPFERTGLKHVKGSVGMARPLENEDGADSVFYIVLDSASFLDGKYAVFGRVVSGMEVVARLDKGDRVTRASVLN